MSALLRLRLRFAIASPAATAFRRRNSDCCCHVRGDVTECDGDSLSAAAGDDRGASCCAYTCYRTSRGHCSAAAHTALHCGLRALSTLGLGRGS